MPRRGHVPQRTCLACRSRRPAGSMLRVAVDAAGVARIDASRIAVGRGAWLCPTERCLERVRGGALSRALRHPRLLVGDLLAQARADADAAVEQALQFAWRSGLVVAGAGRLSGGRSEPIALVVAINVGKTTVDALRVAFPNLDTTACTLTSERLGQVVGKGHRAAIIVMSGAPSSRFLDRLRVRTDLG